jgi:L-lactate dehydrogenase
LNASGGVGSASASSLIHHDICKNLYIYDKNESLAEGVVMDLEDEAFFEGTHVTFKPLKDFKDCEVIVITAGAKQKPGEPRTELIKRNASILKSTIDGLGYLDPRTILLVVSNPVDVLTGLAQKWTENMLPKSRVIGSGTYLDTQRLRVAMSKKLGASPRSIHAYVLGEHGDSQIVPRSIARVGGVAFDNLGIGEEDFTTMVHTTKRKAYDIIERKGSTSHGIGECVASICSNIIHDERRIMCVSVYNPQFNSHIGWPAIVGRDGVEKILDLELQESEFNQLKESANVIQGICNDILTNKDC